MPAKLEPISKLNYAWPKGENDWNLGMDENLRRIGVLLQNGVESHTAQVPASPVVGKLYIVPPSATGAWAGKSGQIATWEPSAWFFVEPRDGMIMYNVNTKDILVYIGASWVSVVATDPTYVAFKAAYDAFVTSTTNWRNATYVNTQSMVDTRTPKWYVDTYGLCTKDEFVQTNFNGLNLNWATVSTLIGHSGASTGYVKQVAYCSNSRMFIRQSISDTAWGAWVEQETVVGSAAKISAMKIGNRNYLVTSAPNFAVVVDSAWKSGVAKTKADTLQGYAGPLTLDVEFYLPTASTGEVVVWFQVGGAGIPSTNIIPSVAIPTGTKGLYRLNGTVTVGEIGLGEMSVSMRVSGAAYTGMVLQKISLQRGSTSSDISMGQDELGTAALANLAVTFDDNTVGRVARIGDWGLGTVCQIRLTPTNVDDQKYKGCFFFSTDNASPLGSFYAHGVRVARAPAGNYADLLMGYGAGARPWAVVTRHVYNNGAATEQTLYSSMNPIVFTTADASTAGRLVTVSSTGEFKSKGFTVDANGFYKSASPIVRLYADHIELNDDASHQDITFERVSVGHYLVKGSSGFATDGWWLNVPVDSNGNKIVASTHETLDDGTLSIKTYKRKFDIETASIVPDLDNPVDIPTNSIGESRWIDIRLIEIDLPQVEDYIPLDLDDDVTESAE